MKRLFFGLMAGLLVVGSAVGEAAEEGTKKPAAATPEVKDKDRRPLFEDRRTWLEDRRTRFKDRRSKAEDRRKAHWDRRRGKELRYDPAEHRTPSIEAK